MSKDDRIPGPQPINTEQLRKNAERMVADLPTEVPLVERCPNCDTQGHYDARVTVGGRGIWRCFACGTNWQDASEEPHGTGKDARIDTRTELREDS